MASILDLFTAHRLIFGYWNQNGDKYYFGHITDDDIRGIVEVDYQNGKNEKRQYNLLETANGLELHISNFEFIIQILNENQMQLRGPLPTGVLMNFEKLPNKISYSM